MIEKRESQKVISRQSFSYWPYLLAQNEPLYRVYRMTASRKSSRVFDFKHILSPLISSFIGYGFCEYSDQETAMSAMRNLNGRELHGRNLRVDHATRDHGVDPKV